VQIRDVPTVPVKSPKSLEDQLKISQISEIHRGSSVFESFVYVSSAVVFLIFIG
jgi:DNA polymerase II small subunit/DNA polymerase delta subunit B